MADPKHVAAMIASSIHAAPDMSGGAGGAPDPSAPDAGGDSGSTDLDPGESQAADEAMQALQSQDADGFAKALKSFIQICVAGSGGGSY